MSAAMDFIESQVLLHPDLAEQYSKLGELHSRRLWHQLTLELAAFVQNEAFRREDNFIALYSNFISTFEAKLNQLEFAKIMAFIARAHTDPQAAIAFFDEVLTKKARLGVDASLYLELLLWLYKLSSGPAEAAARPETLAQVRGVLEGKRAEVEALQGVMDTCVHSAFYQLATEYYKEAGPPEAYYKNALMLLAYTPVETLSPAQATSLATDMSLAAISGDAVYNFGEVLDSPIVNALAGTDNAWLVELLRCFHRGNVDQFNTLVDAHSEQYYAQPALKLRHEFIKEKLALLCLMNFLFETPAQDRNISFTAVAERTRLPVDQVEWLAMRAMSLGLIRGTMDEVDQILHVDWVQPRVLDNEQMAHLAGRLGEWAGTVSTMSNFIEDQAPELFS